MLHRVLLVIQMVVRIIKGVLVVDGKILGSLGRSKGCVEGLKGHCRGSMV